MWLRQEADIPKAMEPFDFDPAPDLYDGVRIDSSPLSVTAIASSLAVLYGAAFQAGYFIRVGVEFVPMLGALDILFPAAVLLTLMVLWYPLAEFGYRHVNRRLSDGSLHKTFFYLAVAKYFKYDVAIFWFAVALVIASGVDISVAFPWLAMVGLFYFSTIVFCYLRANVREIGRLLPSNCLWFLIHSAMLSVTLGNIYAGYFAGRQCWFRTSHAYYWDAQYLRALGDGHLLRKAGRTVYLNKADVKEISCGAFRPERRPGEPLTEPRIIE